MADVVPLRAESAVDAALFTGSRRAPAIFDDPTGPGRLAARWNADGTVGITVADGSLPVEFRLAAEDVLELVRVLVEGLNEQGPVRLGPPAPVLPLTPRASGPAVP
jgi:hypothetical protein